MIVQPGVVTPKGDIVASPTKPVGLHDMCVSPNPTDKVLDTADDWSVTVVYCYKYNMDYSV